MSLDSIGGPGVPLLAEAPRPQPAQPPVHEGLALIAGPLDAPGLVHLPAADDPVGPGGGKVLQQIDRLLTDLSGKAETIYGRLSADLGARLDAALGGMDGARQDSVKELLHFAWYSLSGTTAESRVDIRTALTAYIAQGGDLDQAFALKTLLKGAGTGTLAALRQNIEQGIHPAHALAQNLLDPRSESAPQDLAALRPVLMGFAPEPGRPAGCEYAGLALTLERGVDVGLTIGNLSASFVSLEVPEENRNLSEADVQRLRDLFADVASTRYARTGGSLDFMRFVREQRAETPDRTMAEAFARYDPSGADIVRHDGRGDCLCLADTLRERLARREPPITGLTVGQYNSDLPRQRVGDAIKYPDDRRIQSAYVTHMDVVVPYTDEAGDERVLFLTPGMGYQERFFQDMSIDEFQANKAASVRVGVEADGAVALLLPAGRSIKEGMGYLTNLQMLNNSQDTQAERHAPNLCGIDLIGGTVYLNRLASADFTGIRPGDQAQGSIRFDYRAARANPDGECIVLMPNPDSGELEERAMGNLEAFVLFLGAVGRQFGQDESPAQLEDFIQSVIDLTYQEENYKQAVLWDSVKAIHAGGDA
jgi:hypothetical protein